MMIANKEDSSYVKKKKEKEKMKCRKRLLKTDSSYINSGNDSVGVKP